MNALAGSAAPSLPLRLGRYLLLRELAAGGMGRVYAARVGGARGFEKLVAVKLIHDQFAREERFRTMFFEEARLASRIEHRNVCTVLDFGEEEGVVYLVMEFLSGRPLSTVRKRLVERPELFGDPAFPAMAAHLVAEALEGLHAIHSATDEEGNALNVVHRDISPENLFVTFDGAVKVMDLGVAHASGRVHKTRPGEFKGKMAYAAPEQFDTGPADPRSDLWAAGAVLWELLVGRYLFWKGNERETLKAILTADVPVPSQARPGLPVELDGIVLRALRAEPSERFQSAREMAKELHRFVAGRVGHLGTSEVGEWLDRLFPGERRGYQDLLSQARSLGSAELEHAPKVQRTLVLPSEPGAPPSSHVAPVPQRLAEPAGSASGASGWEDEPTAVHGEAGLPSDPDGGPTLRDPRPSGLLATPPPSASAAAPGGTPPPLSEAEVRSQLRGPDLGPARRRGLLYLGGAVLVALLALALVKGLGGGGEEADGGEPRAGQVAPAAGSGPAAVAPGSEAPPPPSAPPSKTEGAAAGSAVEVLAPPVDPTAGANGEGAGAAESASDEAERVRQEARAARARRRAEAREARGSRSGSARGAAAARGEPGYLSVALRGGWADILVDGERVGRTPKRLRLPPGRHRVELRPFGQEPAIRRTVRIASGRTERLVVDAPGH